MTPPFQCQACRRTATDAVLQYRRGDEIVNHDSLIQCDICERYACSDCLEVYDILSGHDFLCHTCAPTFCSHLGRSGRGH